MVEEEQWVNKCWRRNGLINVGREGLISAGDQRNVLICTVKGVKG